MVEIEYSPMAVATPPRLMGMPHSLTLMKATSGGSCAMIFSTQSSCQPQSQTMSFCPRPACRMPS